MIGKTIQPEIDALVQARDFTTLSQLLSDLPPPDLAELLSDIPERDQTVLFRLLPRRIAAETFEYFDHDTQQSILNGLARGEVAGILNDMHPDDRTALLEELPGQIVRDLVALMSSEERKVAQNLLGYPADSIGRLMTPDYVAVLPGWTMGVVLDHVRKVGTDSETLNILYVVDEQGRLKGDIRIGEVLLGPQDRTVEEVCGKNFVALLPADHQETAIPAFRKYGRVALPVVDGEGRLIGIVTIDDALSVAVEETTEDIQKFGGLEALEEPYL